MSILILLLTRDLLMKFLSKIVPLAVLAVTVSSTPISRRDVNDALIPQFGFQPGVNPTGTLFTYLGNMLNGIGFVGTGDCDGAVNGTDGKPIKIPCSCPPDRQTFVQASLHSLPLLLDSHHNSPGPQQ